MDPQLLTYVQQARNAGVGDEEIAAQLRSQGWQENVIAEALDLGDAQAAVPELERPGGLPPGQYETDAQRPESAKGPVVLLAVFLVLGLVAAVAAFVVVG